jgi:hypothetical protein
LIRELYFSMLPISAFVIPNANELETPFNPPAE